MFAIFLKNHFVKIIFLCLNIYAISEYSDEYSIENSEGEYEIPEYLLEQLNDCYSGDTFAFSSISKMILNDRLEDDVYQFQFSSSMNDFLRKQILIGQLNTMSQIRSAKLCFYGEDGTKEYQSSRHSLGHQFQISVEETLTFSYATCWLQLQPNSDFHPDSLFFHLSNHDVHVYNADFHIRWFNTSPDTYERSILSINDEIPAPTIIVTRGDFINITIINELSEPTAIHWHGLSQRHSLHMDGVPGVTQCEILPGQSFIYTFSTEGQSGTFWYHSHYAMQYGDGLKGALIIKDPDDPWKSYYQDEEVLQITDWYHVPAHILLQTYLYPGTLDPVPDTILINGIGQYDCDSNGECPYYRTSICSGETKRFRIINTSAYATITLTIDQHRMRLIESDGTYLNGKKYVESLRLSPGQRYSVLITTKKTFKNSFWIRATIHPFVDYNDQYTSVIHPTVQAILEYFDEDGNKLTSIFEGSNEYLSIINQSISFGQTFSDEVNLIPMKSNVPTNGNVRRFFLDSQHKGSQPGFFYINNHTFVHPTSQMMLASIVYDKMNDLQLSQFIRVENDNIVDLVINNIDFAPHPFHLHGHHVWILAQGNRKEGYINETTIDDVKLNLKNPIYRDTFTINPYSYAIVRFKANNPGIWMLHCHNDWHLQLGMASVIIESPELVKDFYSKHNLIDCIPEYCKHHLM
ncbi:unnamed protein product [Adineta ricciae]|uniref:Uncharacterized protein n=1 Tax=Adineta ricciae TaxID=249248 RepID=A0A815MH92_ADIRI|nr:unnamed protein product [Adineta ricciae]